MYTDLISNEQIITEKDSIVIIEHLEGIVGGRTLDVSGFTPEVINAGHLIIQETSSGNYKPMPVVGGATPTDYDVLPTGHTYAGVLIASILTAKPFAAILLKGTVNHAAAAFSITSIMDDVQNALPLIRFIED